MEANRRSSIAVSLAFCVPLGACGSSKSNGKATAPSDDPGFFLIGPSEEQLELRPSAADLRADVFVNAISDNGLVVVGMSAISTIDFTENSVIAYRWTRETGTVSLGSLPGDYDIPIVADMTPDGSVLVGATNYAMRGRAFRWTRSGMVDITPSAGESGAALALSEDGDVAAGYFRPPESQEDTWEQAFVWTRAKGSFALGNVPGEYGAIASYVSRDGGVVAGITYGDGGSTVRNRLFRWTEASGMTLVESMPGCEHFTISVAKPPFMGGHCGPGGLNGGGQSYLWREETGLVLLGNPPDADSSQPYSVSDDGSVAVGPSALAGASAGGFRWTRATGVSEALTVPDVQSISFLVGTRIMNDDGSIVVGTGSTGNPPSAVAFRWTSESVTLLEPLPGDVRASVLGVSGDGRTIAGSSINNAVVLPIVWTTGGPTRIEDHIAQYGFNTTRVAEFLGVAPTRDGNVLYGRANLTGGGIYGWLLKVPDTP